MDYGLVAPVCAVFVVNKAAEGCSLQLHFTCHNSLIFMECELIGNTEIQTMF